MSIAAQNLKYLTEIKGLDAGRICQQAENQKVSAWSL